MRMMRLQTEPEIRDPEIGRLPLVWLGALPCPQHTSVAIP